MGSSENSAERIEAKFGWARNALQAAQVAAGKDAEAQGLVEPDGWRWRVLTDLEVLRDVIVRDYTKARDKQKSQAWESRLGPIITGGGAGVGAVVAAIGAGIAKSGRWGWVLIVVGVLFAIVGSVLGANSYVRNRNQKLRYLRLMHGLGDYAYLLLSVAEPADAFQQLDNFRQLWESAGT
ncbi:hypothetical protein [Acidithrix sp. C25]|uniref:hypothetical protein n=1 Tax=Acidithrix sp. C25 TaxID=1671482 RepID=UPI00191BB453|nr:hypothetical protein [Acidithrix sp. C25]CAG4902302.1 unnamed protein product [Acidithrix sp. C25]